MFSTVEQINEVSEANGETGEGWNNAVWTEAQRHFS